LLSASVRDFPVASLRAGGIQWLARQRQPRFQSTPVSTSGLVSLPPETRPACDRRNSNCRITKLSSMRARPTPSAGVVHDASAGRSFLRVWNEASRQGERDAIDRCRPSSRSDPSGSVPTHTRYSCCKAGSRLSRLRRHSRRRFRAGSSSSSNHHPEERCPKLGIR